MDEPRVRPTSRQKQAAGAAVKQAPATPSRRAVKKAAQPATSSTNGDGAVRRSLPRREHAALGNLKRDPIALLEISSAGRVAGLVPLRYGRMLESPFAFFRGSAIIQAHDLAGTPNSGIIIQIAGDCHLSNFGGFASPERKLLFDLNDFDETAPGPWEWDLKRLSASLMLVARHLRHKRGVGDDLVYAMVRSYQQRMQEYAQMSLLDTWYDAISFERLVAETDEPEVQKRIRRAMERAADRTHHSLLSKLTEVVDGRMRMIDAPPHVFHIHGHHSLFDPKDDWLHLKDLDESRAVSATLDKAFNGYLETLAPDRRELLSHFRRQDTAFKVVGVGSVGTRCLAQLLLDPAGEPLFLQIKEADVSVIARYFRSKTPAHHGERVVQGQRLMQAASDLFLGWFKGPRGRCFYVRQLRDMKLSVQIELLDAEMLGRYASVCGWVLARGHAKAGGRARDIAAYLGRSDKFATAMAAYADGYADQVERDYGKFVDACRSGRLQARTDADMAQDFRI